MFKIFGEGKKQSAARLWTFGTMLVFGVIGLTAAFVLTIEKFHLLENPNAVLSCSFNLVLNCSEVMKTWQSSVFGFPNMLIGLMAYPIVITVAVAGLAGVRFPRWFLLTAQVFYILGALFAYWLLFQSIYVIQILCPWCLIVTFATTLILSSLTHYNLRENTFGFAKKTQQKIQGYLEKDIDKLITASWIVLLVVLIYLKFGDSLFL